MPTSKRPIRPRHAVAVALVIAVAMLSYFVHLVNLAVQRGHAPRAQAAATFPQAAATFPQADDTDTIAFAVHTVVAPR